LKLFNIADVRAGLIKDSDNESKMSHDEISAKFSATHSTLLIKTKNLKNRIPLILSSK
jgi:hypothetical protein